jgi:hypothetical protein
VNSEEKKIGWGGSVGEKKVLKKKKKLGWLAPRVPIHKEYPVNKKEGSQPRPQSAAALAIAKNTCIPLD